MTDLAPLIYDLALMLGVAGIIVLLFQRIHQPVVLGYLVAGMLIGPYTWSYNLLSDTPNIKILSELGVIFLMFSLGLEFSFQKLTIVGFSALLTGLFDVSLMIALGYGAGLLLGFGYYDCLFLGAAVAISSTTIIVKAINELNLKTKRFAEVIFGVLIVEDLLAILLLAALSTVVLTKNLFSFDMLLAAAKLILVVGGWFLVGYFLVPSLFRRFAHYVSQETLTIVSVALCLFLVTLAASYHYSAALGAFIMGSILAETVLVHRIEELIIPIRDIFGAVFFISVGMLINPHTIIEQWPAVLLISLVVIFGKITVISIGTFLTGQSVTTAVRAGFGMGQIGEFSFIIATLGLALHVINDTLYPIIVAVSSITTFTTPYMIRLSGKLSTSLENNLPERVKYFLEGYAAWVYRTQSSTHGNPPLRSITIRFMINAIIVVIIFAFVYKWAFPSMIDLVDNKHNAKMLSEMLAIAMASPFIWGMVFSYKLNDIPDYAKSKLTPVVFLLWLFTLIEIIFLSVLYFHTWVTTAALLVIAMTFFFISYRQLEKSYHWFERQLIKNISRGPVKAARYFELAPWETHLVEIDVSEKSIFVGKTLAESQIRQQYGVNIVAICHGARIIPAPRGEERIVANDRLIVLGNDQQLDAFKSHIEVLAPIKLEPVHFLENFTLKPLLLENSNPLIGKSIRDSLIRENVNGIIVGIERNNNRILNPDSEMIFQADDLVFIVGDAKKLKNYIKMVG